MKPSPISPPGNLRAVPDFWPNATREHRARIASALTDSILPFWRRTLDESRGGVFNCWNNTGTQLISRDKFTWSQGRFLWMWSRLAELTRRGWLPGSPETYLSHAEKTRQFLKQHAFLKDGTCVLLLSEDGQPKEVAPGSGFAPSVYADCFVAMGFAEYARVTRNATVLQDAWVLFDSIGQRVASGRCPTHPTPIPEGHDAYALAMIYLNVALVLRAACDELGSPLRTEAAARSTAAAARIFDTYIRPEGCILEFRLLAGGEPDTLLCRHLNPGHALEGTWMLMMAAVQASRSDWLAKAAQAVRFSMQTGWDDTHGGLLYFIDREGGAPRGQSGGSAYETAVQGNWDAKLWWVHSEANYATLLSYRLTGDKGDLADFRRIFDYTFRIFPNPDAAVGEWIQIRNRRGEPLDKVVALPVKDPYHIARNLIQMLELFSTRDATLPV